MFWKSVVVFSLLGSAAGLRAETMLQKVRSTKVLSCGINRDLIEYSNADAHGNRAAFDIDLCKAVAIAVLGANAKFTITAYPDEPSSLKALAAGAVALVPTVSKNFGNTAGGQFGFSAPVLYDAQGFLAPKSLNLKSPADLSGKKICFLAETEVEVNLRAYVAREKIDFVPFPFQEQGEMEAAFVTNNCAAISSDMTQLANMRRTFRSRRGAYEILTQSIAEDPLAMAYSAADPALGKIVDWTIQALIQAEASGVTQANTGEMSASQDPVIQRLLGVAKGYGKKLDLDDDFARRTIKAVGNYGEIYQRDLGEKSGLQLPRGKNELWTKGGLLFPLPWRSE